MHDNGTTRSSSRQVAFSHPFQLGGAPEVYAAGVYDIETVEAAHEGLGSTAYVRTSTVMVISTCTGTRDRLIDPDELDEALKVDAERLTRTV